MSKAKKEYTRRNVVLLIVTPKSIQIHPVDEPKREIWISRSTLSYICDESLDRMDVPQEIEIEVMTWLARKEGLI